MVSELKSANSRRPERTREPNELQTHAILVLLVSAGVNDRIQQLIAQSGVRRDVHHQLAPQAPLHVRGPWRSSSPNTRARLCVRLSQVQGEILARGGAFSQCST